MPSIANRPAEIEYGQAGPVEYGQAARYVLGVPR